MKTLSLTALPLYEQFVEARKREDIAGLDAVAIACACVSENLTLTTGSLLYLRIAKRAKSVALLVLLSKDKIDELSERIDALWPELRFWYDVSNNAVTDYGRKAGLAELKKCISDAIKQFDRVDGYDQ